MGFFEIFMIGVGLSMDAFAVAICKGLNMHRLDQAANFGHCLVLWRISGLDAVFGLAARQAV